MRKDMTKDMKKLQADIEKSLSGTVTKRHYRLNSESESVFLYFAESLNNIALFETIKEYPGIVSGFDNRRFEEYSARSYVLLTIPYDEYIPAEYRYNQLKGIAENMLLDAFTDDELQQIASSPEDTETTAARVSADYQAWRIGPTSGPVWPEELPEEIVIDAIRELTAE